MPYKENSCASETDLVRPWKNGSWTGDKVNPPQSRPLGDLELFFGIAV